MSWFTLLAGAVRGEAPDSGRPSKRVRRKSITKRPAIESLEDRCLLAYTITDLGTLGGVHSYAYGLNDAGTVVGASMVTGFRYSHGYVSSGEALTDLGTLKNLGKFSRAEDINGSGHIVGSSNYFNGSAGLHHAFVYKNGTMTDLGALQGPNSFGTGINADGYAVGYANYSGSPTDKYHAFLWNPNDNKKTDLGTLGGDDSKAYDINNAGQVVGIASDSSGSAFATLWDGANKVNIGVLPGSYNKGSEARGINASGQVVGGSYGLFGTHKQVIYHAFLYSNGVITDLGKMIGQDGDWIFAYDINDLGQVVGTANTEFGDSPRNAWIWQSGVMTNLNTEIPQGSGWILREAYAINNNGEIVGFGIKDGKSRAFKLTPTAAPIGGRAQVGTMNADQAPQPLLQAPTIFRESVGTHQSGHFAIYVCPGDDTPKEAVRTVQRVAKSEAARPSDSFAVLATAKLDETTTLNPFTLEAEFA